MTQGSSLPPLSRRIRKRMTRAAPKLPSGNGLVMLGHIALAAFLCIGRYPATQDGPAHAYTVHVLDALLHDPSSVYHRYFTANLHFGSNGLFFYAGLWASRWMSIERFTSLVFFLSLVLLPLSAFAFSRSLSAAMAPPNRLPMTSAWSLACPLAYSYFLYRGLFNYSLGLSFAFFALAAVVAQGAQFPASRRALLFSSALLATALAAFAHASAIAFLLAAIPVACLDGNASGSRARRMTGLAAWLLLVASTRTSHIGSDGPLDASWWSPWKSLALLVRAFGVTQSWAEIAPAITLILVLAWTVARLAPELLKLRSGHMELWPVALGLIVLGGYFVVPNTMRGISGLNERLPLFAAMLILPYVPADGRTMRAVAWAAIPFFAYVGAINERKDARLLALKDAADAVRMEKGSIVHFVPLDLKLGSLTADLGRYFGADVARRHDAVTANVFVGNPVFPLLETRETPKLADVTPVEAFARMSSTEQSRALNDKKSPIRRFFADTVTHARGAQYLVVVPKPELEDALREFVIRPLDAHPARGFSSALPVYEIPAPRGLADAAKSAVRGARTQAL